MVLIAVYVLLFCSNFYNPNFKVFLCFSDEDEVGDKITVRSDEELKAMLSYVSIYVNLYFYYTSIQQIGLYFTVFSVVAVLLSAVFFIRQ